MAVLREKKFAYMHKIRTWPATCKAMVVPGAMLQTWYLGK